LNAKPNTQPGRDDLIRQTLEAYRDLGITELYLPAQQQQTAASTSPDTAENQARLEHLRHSDLGVCTRCKLHRGRKTIVFGEGDPAARLMLVGEAPGADEDVQGRPFVGRAGQLLMQMIKAIDFERQQVYIANVLKCRPPENRPPEPDEIKQCSPFLLKQIEIIRPKVILALGTHAAQLLLSSGSSIGMLRSRVYDMPFGRVIATYHPSYLLRTPQKKVEAWEDLKLVRRTLQE
jgi:DNA polymerase